MGKSWSDPVVRPQLLLTLVLALLSAVGFHLLLVQMGGADRWSPLVAVLVALAALAAWRTLSLVGLSGHWLASEVLILAGFGVAFLPPPLGGTSSDASLVLRLLAGLRNVVLVAAVVSDRPRTLRIPAVTGTMILLISFSLARGPEIFVTATLFAAAGVAWLGMGCWREFAERLPTTSARQAPWTWALSLALLGGGSFVAGVLLYPASSKGLLEQLVQPTVTETDPTAAARHNAANSQAIQALTVEKYGTPSGDSGAQAVAGANSEEGLAKFSLIRAPHASPPADQDRVLFQVKEQGPGHLPMITYDQMQGSAWRGEMVAGLRAQTAAELNEGKGWRQVLKPLGFTLGGEPTGPDLEAEPKTEAGDVVASGRRALGRLALTLQGGGRVVAPERLPLDRSKVERLLAVTPGNYGHADYRLSGYDIERIREELRATPELGKEAVRHFKTSRQFREEVIRDYLVRRTQSPEAALPPELRQLLRSWIRDTPRGWDQIEALIRGLRGHARFDPEATIPAGEKDPLRYFLLESRRGPDYLFASAAVVFLRHLGYPSRLVAGFYVRPGDYRLLTQTTPVRASDVHYWAQVRSPNQLWINLEPTPGYEPARPDYTFQERLAGTSRGALDMLVRHWPALLAALTLGVAVFAFRRRLLERLATVAWLLSSGRPARRLVRATWQLIDRRARTAGVARGQGVTLPVWSAAVGASTPELGQRLAELAALADRMTHAPEGARDRLGRPDAEVRAACRGAVRRCTVRALRQALSPRHRTQEGNHVQHHR